MLLFTYNVATFRNQATCALFNQGIHLAVCFHLEQFSYSTMVATLKALVRFLVDVCTFSKKEYLVTLCENFKCSTIFQSTKVRVLKC